MIIICTECETRYIVAPQAIGKDGRLVKCSKCAHSWFEEPPEEGLEIVPEQILPSTDDPDTNAEDDMKPTHEKKDPVMAGENSEETEIKRNVPAVIKEKSHNIMIGWIVLIALLLGGAYSMYSFRQSLEKKFPVAEMFYEKIDYFLTGKKPPAQPIPPQIIVTKAHPASYLAMRQSAEIRFIGGAPSLSLALEISNSGEIDVELPVMTGVIKNAQGSEVYTWVMKLDPSFVPAGGAQQFNINVDNIPATSVTAEVSFDWK